MVTGIADTLWSLEGIAEKIEANRPRPGKRGPYKKRGALILLNRNASNFRPLSRVRNHSLLPQARKIPFSEGSVPHYRNFRGLEMTDAQRRAAIQTLIKKHTDANTTSQAVARASLIKEGIYTKKGNLRVEFGGETKKSKSAA